MMAQGTGTLHPQGSPGLSLWLSTGDYCRYFESEPVNGILSDSLSLSVFLSLDFPLSFFLLPPISLLPSLHSFLPFTNKYNSLLRTIYFAQSQARIDRDGSVSSPDDSN